MATEIVNTLVVNNFRGSMTSSPNGDINSGQTYITNTFANQPFAAGRYGQLSWVEEGVQIDSAGSVITDLIMDGKERVESGILYVYAIGHTGRLYKIQVNDPTTFNPDYDNPVLLAALSVNSPTFTRGGFIQFYGATEKIYIGHDKGVTSINFDGTSEAFVGLLGSWTQNVPRPLRQFIGILYIGNGSNIAAIDTTATVTSYTRLSPGFPTNSQVRDMDVTSDGNYLQAVVSTLPMHDITAATQNTSSSASATSYIFKWNGTDPGYTAFDTFPTFSLTANLMFQNYQYTFGYDQFGMAVFNPTEKILTVTEETAPLPNAVSSTGNMVTWMAPLFYAGNTEMTYGVYGSMDFELSGYWSTFGQVATGTETDIVQCPWQLPVSNFGVGASSNGYADNVFSNAKIYYSTLETSAAPTTKYKLYKWNPGDVRGNAFAEAVYQTQTQLFSKKIQVKQVRIYTEPLVTNNSFSIGLIGPGGTLSGTPMTNGSSTFTVGTNVTAGQDYIWWNPAVAPTYALGLLITNLGNANWFCNKIEVDYTGGGI